MVLSIILNHKKKLLKITHMLKYPDVRKDQQFVVITFVVLSVLDQTY